jgi:pSer/pThr/pTyr-binding forkhead associated (FHA) protein
MGEEDTTVSLDLIEGRRALEEEIGDVLDQLPEGFGMLVVRRGPNAGSTFVLEADSTSLGRHPDSDIFLDDVTVSRRHAIVRRAPDGYQVSDAGSLNGTYVDRQRVEKAMLHDMNELQVGRFVLTFVLGARAEAAT